MPTFDIVSSYEPTGDQPEAIRQLTEGILSNRSSQVLLGVTGSGKTFTIANVIRNVNKPTLILSHNKTLAAQLYSEFKGFFPNNAVEYYVSYYDYYQPEAYISSTDTYIEKDLAINEEIDKLRLAATSALLSGRKDVIVVASISCIYGMGNPSAFYDNVISLKTGMTISRNSLMKKLVSSLYARNDITPQRGCFTAKGDTVKVYLAYSDDVIRISFWDDTIDRIDLVSAESGNRIASFDEYRIYPANLFLTTEETQMEATRQIEADLTVQEALFKEQGKTLEATRMHQSVTYEVEMIRELGNCTGIENYPRYFDGRKPRTRPYCLLDFFPKDFLLVIDESHVSVPQLRAMYGGDRSRKESLVQYGFRLPAALDNRPLKEEEFWQLVHQTIFVSATPADFELQRSEGIVVEQVIRPTGLLDPSIEIRPTINQLDDLMEEIRIISQKDERILVTALTKRMAEDLTQYLMNHGIRANYIHSDVDTLERIQILNELRKGIIQVLVGVNLLREGLDLPEVSLVAILDADKEGFLRSHRSLTQTAGRAARNINGKVIMYADTITESMQKTIDETNRRREKQIRYNAEHHIQPRPIQKEISSELVKVSHPENEISLVAEKQPAYGILRTEKDTVDTLRKKMAEAAGRFDFILAAQYRDEMLKMQEKQKSK